MPNSEVAIGRLRHGSRRSAAIRLGSTLSEAIEELAFHTLSFQAQVRIHQLDEMMHLDFGLPLKIEVDLKIVGWKQKDPIRFLFYAGSLERPDTAEAVYHGEVIKGATNEVIDQVASRVSATLTERLRYCAGVPS